MFQTNGFQPLILEKVAVCLLPTKSLFTLGSVEMRQNLTVRTECPFRVIYVLMCQNSPVKLKQAIRWISATQKASHRANIAYVKYELLNFHLRQL